VAPTIKRDDPPPSSDEAKNAWSYTYTPPYVFTSIETTFIANLPLIQTVAVDNKWPELPRSYKQLLQQ